MNKQSLSVILFVFFLFSAIVIPLSSCQNATSSPTPTPTEIPTQATPDIFLIVIIAVVVVAAVGGASAFLVVKRRVNEKSLRKASSHAFEDWVIKRFNGKPSDPSSGVTGFTEGGQPLLIKQSEHVNLAEVEGFLKVLRNGGAQKGAIVAFNFDADSLEGRITALDNGIELQMLRINELVNKRFAKRIRSLAQAQVTFEAPITNMANDQAREKAGTLEEIPSIPQVQMEGLKPHVFISNSNTKVADQVKKMLKFLHYDYVMGDKEETTVPISDSKLGLMKTCDCAIINICAAEQERRYSGLYVLNSNVTSEINAAYLKYNTQVILLTERKVDLPPNFKGLKRIEYDTDDLSFNAAMDLEKALSDFKKL